MEGLLSTGPIPSSFLQSPKKELVFPFLSIYVSFGIGATICIGQEIQCLPYARFFVFTLQIFVNVKEFVFEQFLFSRIYHLLELGC